MNRQKLFSGGYTGTVSAQQYQLVPSGTKLNSTNRLTHLFKVWIHVFGGNLDVEIV